MKPTDRVPYSQLPSEFIALTAQLDACKPYTMRVKEWQGDVVFLHEVAAGAADRSYGIHVARSWLAVAGRRSRGTGSETLEQGEQSGRSPGGRLTAFCRRLERRAQRPKLSGVEAELRDLNPDDLTPRAALEALYRLRGLLEDQVTYLHFN